MQWSRQSAIVPDAPRHPSEEVLGLLQGVYKLTREIQILSCDSDGQPSSQAHGEVLLPGMKCVGSLQGD